MSELGLLRLSAASSLASDREALPIQAQHAISIKQSASDDDCDNIQNDQDDDDDDDDDGDDCNTIDNEYFFFLLCPRMSCEVPPCVSLRSVAHSRATSRARYCTLISKWCISLRLCSPLEITHAS